MYALLYLLTIALSVNAAPVLDQVQEVAGNVKPSQPATPSIDPELLNQAKAEASAFFDSFREGFPLANMDNSDLKARGAGFSEIVLNLESETETHVSAATSKPTPHRAVKIVTVYRHQSSGPTPAPAVQSVNPKPLADNQPASMPANAETPSQVKTPEISAGDRIFNVMTYHEGVPYLHMRPLLLTSQSELVVNGDGDDNVFVGFLSEANTLISVSERNQLNASVAVFPDGALKLGYSAIVPLPGTKGSSSSNKNIAANGLNLVNGNPVGPWDFDANNKNNDKPKGQFLTLGNSSNAWSCPNDKSGVYHIYWSSAPDIRPAHEYGCIKVDLFIPDQPLISKE